jgi:chromosome segregation ATPase
MTIFEQLAGVQQNETNKAMADYNAVVDAIAAGNDPNVDHVSAVLTAAKRTSETLRADVGRRVRRIRQKALAARLPEFQRSVAAIDAQIAEANQVLEQAEAAYDAVIEPLSDSRREACRLQAEAEQAAAELANSCDDPALIRERDEIDAALSRIGTQIPKVRDTAEASEREAARYKQRAATEIRASDADKRSLESLGAKYAEDAKKYRAEIETLQREWNALQKRRDAVKIKMTQA